MIGRFYFPNDLALVTLDNGKKDFDIAKNNDFVRQKIKENLLTWLGECFNNINIGFPYRSDVFINSPDLSLIKSDYRAALLLTPGVKEVTELNLELNKKDRLLFVNFTVSLNNGEFFTIDSRSDQDFIISI